MGAMEDHEPTELVVHPPGPSQHVLSRRINKSGGATSNTVQQLWTVGVNLVASMSTSSLYLAPNLEWVSSRLRLTTPQLPECPADLLEVAVIPTVEPDVLVENSLVPSYLGDICMLPLGVRTPDHLKSKQGISKPKEK